MAKDGEFKQPYLYGEGKAALETPMQAEIYAENLEMESQWKQPWLYDSYPKMEWELTFPGKPPYPSPPGVYPGGGLGDCSPAGAAVGGGAIDPCEPGISCGVWEWSCAHKITKFSVVQGNGWIQSVQYFPNDTVRVTVCWDESLKTEGKRVGPQAYLANGESAVSTVELRCAGEEAECESCWECQTESTTPTITYATQQMSTSGTQDLSASGGGGGPYRWKITSGGGTLSQYASNPGQTVVYTAPASNAGCAYNPTIEIEDYCGGKKTLQIAVNGYADGETAYKTKAAYSCYGPCANGPYWCYACQTTSTAYQCDGSTPTSDWASCVGDIDGIACTSCPCSGYICCTTGAGNICSGCAECYNHTGSGNCPAGDVGTTDIRTTDMKAGGCCPAALL